MPYRHRSILTGAIAVQYSSAGRGLWLFAARGLQGQVAPGVSSPASRSRARPEPPYHTVGVCPPRPALTRAPGAATDAEGQAYHDAALTRAPGAARSRPEQRTRRTLLEITDPRSRARPEQRATAPGATRRRSAFTRATGAAVSRMAITWPTPTFPPLRLENLRALRPSARPRAVDHHDDVHLEARSTGVPVERRHGRLEQRRRAIVDDDGRDNGPVGRWSDRRQFRRTALTRVRPTAAWSSGAGRRAASAPPPTVVRATRSALYADSAEQRRHAVT